jgi:hypothetical protein
MIMRPRLRKLMLTVHIASSVGLLGAVVVFLVLAVIGLTSADAEMVRAAYVAMAVIAWVVIVPLAFASLLVGIVESLGTRWGLFRHYWILAKLALTALVIVVLLIQMRGISTVAGAAAATALSSADLRDVRFSFVLHAGGGLLVLLLPIGLSVFKPRGRTGYGRRKLTERRMAAQP